MRDHNVYRVDSNKSRKIHNDGDRHLFDATGTLLPRVPSNLPICSLLITLLTLSNVALGRKRYSASRRNSACNG